MPNPTPDVLDDDPDVTPVLAVDPTTGEVLADGSGGCPRCEAHERKAEAAIYDLHNAERELRALRRRVKTLEAELRAQRNEAPEAQTVKALFQYWVEKCRKDPKRTKLGEKREKALLARLREGYDANFIKRAIDGAALAPTTIPSDTQRLALVKVMRRAVEMVSDEQAAELRQLYAQEMKHARVFDDLELICRNEVNLERFAALAERLDPIEPKPTLDV